MVKSVNTRGNYFAGFFWNPIALPPSLPLHAQTGTTRWCYTVRALWSIVDARSERVLFRNNAVVCKHSWKQCGRNLTFRDSWSLLLVPRPNVYTTRCKLCPQTPGSATIVYNVFPSPEKSWNIYIYILLDYSIYIYMERKQPRVLYFSARGQLGCNPIAVNARTLKNRTSRPPRRGWNSLWDPPKRRKDKRGTWPDRIHPNDLVDNIRISDS